MADAVFVDTARPTDPIGRSLDRVSRVFAIGSGLMLIGMALMSVYSIAGRSLLGKPVMGDYEMVQMMSAIAVSMALPYCQMVRGHIIVDFFTAKNKARTNAVLDTVASLLLAVCALAIAWRVTVATFEFRATHDATMLLNLPTWWGYAPMGPSFLLLGCAALYTAWHQARDIGATAASA
jgi:TRAP-type C4-dicarboxylate transport system permease small subunit